MKLKNYNAIDLMKLIMAVVVIAIHAVPLRYCTIGWLNTSYALLTQLAVPFFFVATGFLLGKKMSWPYIDKSALETLKKYISRTVKLYVLWSAIYFPLALVEYVSNQYSVSTSVLSYLRGFFLIGEHNCSLHLWYLLSTIYGLMLVYALLSKKVPPIAVGIVCIAAAYLSWGFDWLSQTPAALPEGWNTLRDILLVTIRDGRILRGAYYLPMGMFLAHRSPRARAGVALFALGCMGVFFIKYMYDLGIAACTAGLFIVVEKIELKDSPRYAVFRKMSTVMYLIHMYVLTFCIRFSDGPGVSGAKYFLVTTAVSALAAAACVLVSESAAKQRRGR